MLPAGAVVALVGTLGAGKTRLVQAWPRRWACRATPVTSPTFVFVNEYPQGRLPVYHFDTYRLKDDDEFLELGPDEYFESAGLTFVEWADRVADLLPTERLEITLEVTGETSRRATITALSPAVDPLVERLRALWKLRHRMSDRSVGNALCGVPSVDLMQCGTAQRASPTIRTSARLESRVVASRPREGCDQFGVIRILGHQLGTVGGREVGVVEAGRHGAAQQSPAVRRRQVGSLARRRPARPLAAGTRPRGRCPSVRSAHCRLVPSCSISTGSPA